MHPFTLQRPQNLSDALALRAQAGRNDAHAEYIPRSQLNDPTQANMAIFPFY